jgi:hypothetical protein
MALAATKEMAVQAGGSLWKPALVAAAGAALANGVLFGLGVAAGIFPAFRLDPSAGPQMAVEPILLVSAVAAAVGVGVYGALRTRSADPLGLFLKIAAVVLVLSFAAPFAIPGTTVTQGLATGLLHVVVAAAVVVVVRRADRARTGGT